jgi:hypothetical protein
MPPCKDDYTPNEEADGYRKSLNEAKDKLDNVTELLCSTLQAVEKHGYDKNIMTTVPGLIKWWADHQESDRYRLRGEISRSIHNLPLDTLREIEKLIEGGKK